MLVEGGVAQSRPERDTRLVRPDTASHVGDGPHELRGSSVSHLADAVDSKWPYILGGSVALAVVIGVGIAVFGIERVEKEVQVGASGEVKRNPFFALEQLWSRYAGGVVTRWSKRKPGKATTLIFTRGVPRVTPDRMSVWTDWVGSGHHLVAVAPRVDPEEATEMSPDVRLLQAFGFRPRVESEPLPDVQRRTYRVAPPEYARDESKDGAEDEATGDEAPASDEGDANNADSTADTPDDEASAEESSDGEADASSDETSAEKAESTSEGGETSNDTPDESEEAKEETDASEEGRLFSRSSFRWTSSELDWIAETDKGTVMAVSRPWKEGRVTLIAASEPLRNWHLDNGDVATWARDLLALGPVRSEAYVGIVRFLRRKSWVGYVFGWTWPFFAMLAAIVALALWQGRYRFGPLRDDPGEARRSRLEHVRASGQFLWKRDGGPERLLEATRAALFEDLERRYPGIRDASEAEQKRALAEEWNISEGEVERLFASASEVEMTETTFRDLIETIESYRRTT